MIRRSLAGILFALACSATFLLLAAVIVRFTIQDRWAGFLALYFATPWPVIAAGSAICAVYWFRLGRRRSAARVAGSPDLHTIKPDARMGGIRRCSRLAALGLAMLCVVAVVGWLTQGWQWRRAKDVRGDLRLVHWNVDRPVWRQAGDFRWLAAQDADIISIAEREPRKIKMKARWQAAFPDYQLVPARGETLLLVRGEVLSVTKEMHFKGSYGVRIQTRIRGREVTVLQVDINGDPLLSRAGALTKIAAIVGQHHDENLILVGDFNTPLDSAYIGLLRKEMTNAFEASGSGCAATWPMPLPVLSLDQVWTTPALRPVRCEHFGSWRSDHRAVVAEIDFVRKD